MAGNRSRFLLRALAGGAALFALAAACMPLLRTSYHPIADRIAFCAAFPYWVWTYLPRVLLARVTDYVDLSALPSVIVPCPLPIALGDRGLRVQLFANGVATLIGSLAYGVLGPHFLRLARALPHRRLTIACAGVLAYVDACTQIPRLDLYPKSRLWQAVADLSVMPSNFVLSRIGGHRLSVVPPEPNQVLAWTQDLVLHGLVVFAILFVVMALIDVVTARLAWRTKAAAT